VFSGGIGMVGKTGWKWKERSFDFVTPYPDLILLPFRLTPNQKRENDYAS
jgi:hypothetical protein